MAKTLSGTYNSLYTLSPAYTSFAVAATAALNAGLYGGTSVTWTVANDGHIASSSTASAGTYVGAVSLSANGTITNASIVSGGTTTIGTIEATGTGANGVVISGNRKVINQGNIRATRGGDGVRLGNGSVFNTGYVSGSYTGVRFADTVTNSGTAATIAGGVNGIETALTVINGGTVTGGNIGVLAPSGSVTNQSGGVIDGGEFGVRFGVTLDNSGTVIGGSELAVGGTGPVNNRAGALISGYHGVRLSTNALVNAGTIKSNAANAQSGYAAYLGSGSGTTVLDSLTNAQTGVISAAANGVIVPAKANGTLMNAGTIIGGVDAVKFCTGANLLIVEPGAVSTGAVVGGTGKLELASAATAGTLSGLGSKYSGFNLVATNAGAAWNFTGANAGTVSNSGTAFIDPSSTLTALLLGTGHVTIT
jgi:hypothetical protein